ncbi:MAG: N-methyl-L-tryptophan oxidase [Roseiflexaceae bacterium]|nr:N-methyl-L-tryptophan oxidase [Roseiflexaceae bacterium]
MSQNYDVIIIGLGGMGSAAAYQLASRGMRVLGLERFTPGHSEGSSHGQSRVIRQAYFEDPAYVPLLLRAYELWEQIERDSGKSLLTITGGLMIGSETSHTFTGSRQSAQLWNLPHEILNATDIQRRFPPLLPTPDVVALYEAKAGFLHPEQSVIAHLDIAAARGAELHFREPALSWESRSGSVRVTTADAVYEAETLIISPGAWAPALMSDLQLPFTITRQVLYWFDPIGGIAPFDARIFPVYIWEVAEDLQFYGFPAQPNVPGVKAAIFHRGQDVSDPNQVDRTISDADTAYFREILQPRIPTLNGPLLSTATCLYTEVPDQHFIIANHPHHENVVIASPCSGHGYKFCSVVGEILADLAIDRTTRHPIGLFDPARFSQKPS